MSKQPIPKSLKHILTIEKFKLDAEEVSEVYPRAYSLPAFFSHNLLSPRRVVKYFQGGQALVGAFYYQLMKLALELEPEEVNYRDIIFRKFVQFDLFGQGELEDDVFSDFQYRKFFKDFIEIVEKEDVPNFEKSVQFYPIIDEILIKYFKIILPMPLLMELERTTRKPMQLAREVLTFLCKQFQITLTQIGPCFKLEESDTFLYFQNIQEIFLAFNEIVAEPADEESSDLASTFECGVGNSFITKYHPTLTDQTQKFKQTQQESIMLIQTKENVGHFPVTLSDEPFLASNTQMSKISKSSSTYRPLAETSEQSSVPFQSLASLLNKDIKRLHPTLCKPPEVFYSEFTDSLILKEMPTLYRDGIKTIKDKYRKDRASIRTFL